ncbi:MAG: ATP-dependent helicase [Bacteriovoracaceae bacterium]
MVKALTSTHSNICVVGDDDQSIYAFRGADITNILNFERFFPSAKLIKLEQNYRSTTLILELANKVIKENKKRKDKTMFSEVEGGPKPALWACGNSDHEAQVVVDEIVKYQMKGKFLGEVAILYRSNTQVPPFEDQLRLAQVPYTIIGGQKFYEKKEIKDLIGYLSVINNPKDELSLRRILNIPHRGIGTKTLQSYLSEAKELNKSLFQVIKLKAQEDSKRGRALKDFVEIINKGRDHFQNMRLDQALSSLIGDIGYLDFVEKSYDSPKIVARKKDDVKNFIFSADKFNDRFAEEASLTFWLERLLLADVHDKQSDDDNILKNEVQLMTLHSSKGLEFDTVYMVGVEEELLPHKNCIKQDTEIDEERRLCYVGITRAQRRLILTYAKERKIYGKDIPRNKSRFLIKLDQKDLLEQDRTNFGHLSSEEEVEEYKSSFFNDLLSSLED